MFEGYVCSDGYYDDDYDDDEDGDDGGNSRSVVVPTRHGIFKSYRLTIQHIQHFRRTEHRDAISQRIVN